MTQTRTQTRNTKPLEEMNLMDDFLMNEMTASPEMGIPFCREVLPVLLGRQVGKLRVVAQKIIPGTDPGKRGIRMDVEIYDYGQELPQEEHTHPKVIYDLEPHLKKDMDIIRHNRFYQAKLDGHNLNRGERDFTGLPDLYVITILDYDPFGYDYMMYTIQNRCLELPEMDYPDGLHFLYFFADGSKGGSQEIKEMLHYFQSSNITNAVNHTLQTIHGYVEKLKQSSEVQVSYMRYEDLMWECKNEGRTEGRIEGRIEDIIELLEDLGTVSDELSERLHKETDLATLKKWHKLAARATSIEDWQKQVGLL
ncbi:MAG: hypothetical protein Q4B57_03515 [Eubacteriales bacterium]|nr:hypothetical protein [Eubacteriales bacterium]